MKRKNKTPAKSDAVLQDIRKALEKYSCSALRWFPMLLDRAWVQANVAKRERAKFKSFLLTIERLGDVDLEKIARRVRVSKELFDKWMNAPEVASRVNNFRDRGRWQRAKTFLVWAKMFSKKHDVTLKAPPNADGEIHEDRIDYLPVAKYAALLFEDPESFRQQIAVALDFHKRGRMSYAKEFLIALGKCLSHGTRGTRGINPELYDKLDLDIADIILSHDPPISDKDAVHELQNRGHMLNRHLPTLEARFRQRKRRLLFDAQPIAWVSLR